MSDIKYFNFISLLTVNARRRRYWHVTDRLQIHVVYISSWLAAMVLQQIVGIRLSCVEHDEDFWIMYVIDTRVIAPSIDISVREERGWFPVGTIPTGVLPH